MLKTVSVVVLCVSVTQAFEGFEDEIVFGVGDRGRFLTAQTFNSTLAAATVIVFGTLLTAAVGLYFYYTETVERNAKPMVDSGYTTYESTYYGRSLEDDFGFQLSPILEWIEKLQDFYHNSECQEKDGCDLKKKHLKQDEMGDELKYELHEEIT